MHGLRFIHNDFNCPVSYTAPTIVNRREPAIRPVKGVDPGIGLEKVLATLT